MICKMPETVLFSGGNASADSLRAVRPMSATAKGLVDCPFVCSLKVAVDEDLGDLRCRRSAQLGRFITSDRVCRQFRLLFILNCVHSLSKTMLDPRCKCTDC
jgi:hypothetical protein